MAQAVQLLDNLLNDVEPKNNLLVAVTKEIKDLHKFFVDWYNGWINKEDKPRAFKDFKSRFDNTFTMDTCSGSIINCETVVKWIETNYECEKPGR